MKDFLRLMSLFRPQAGWLALGLLLSLLTLLANLVLMATSGWFIAAMGLAGVAGVTMNYFTPAAIIRACAIVRTTGRYGERLVTHDATLRVLSGLRQWFYRRLEPLAPAGLEGERSGTLLSAIGSDIDTLDNAYLRILLPMVVALVAGGLLLAWLWSQSPNLALVAGGLLLLAGVLAPLGLARRSARVARRELEELRELRSEAVDALEGLGELMLHGADDRLAARLAQRSRDLGRAQLRASRWRTWGQAVVSSCAWLALWGMLVLLIPEVHTGARPPAELSLFALLALAGFEMAVPLPLAFQALAPTLDAARRLFRIADRPLPVPESDGPAPSAEHTGFTFHEVSLRYPAATRPALNWVSLELPPGRHTAIVGPTGAGKSSLLQLMLRFRLPDSGKVTFGGHDLRQWPGEALRAHLSVVEQQGHLFIGTLRQNLLLADPEATQRRLWQALRLAQLADWVEGLPEGLDTPIGEAALKISGGEAKRLAIARALLRDAPVLLLDEPTEGLDRRTARRLMEALLERWQGRTLVLVTHQLDFLPKMDQVVLMDQGRVLARGSHGELLEGSGEYAALMELSPVFGD